MARWPIDQRAKDLEGVDPNASPEVRTERQIDRIVEVWGKNGIPDWAKKAIARGENPKP